MHDVAGIALACASGGALGAGFFAGLYWTIQRGLSSTHPALWFLGSLIVRTALLLLGFYFVAGGHWQRLLACMVGFLMARLIVSRSARALPEASLAT
ncbi:ATP synthase subunit I [Engelhardtia mirabilis]|uniref:N-ATPase, AtpR subunit n=1 Tax=Engelhardtia mirabilis TaxID=2528011 RepID=A0A518BE62_9BACT|nr:N-ATPase, AtpR subunit [Planctomycetes bacterium Pla133]QDU99587.1 N-ATPase, AtpR subunit [Planctomycetes bacterium Pla86]